MHVCRGPRLGAALACSGHVVCEAHDMLPVGGKPACPELRSEGNRSGFGNHVDCLYCNDLEVRGPVPDRCAHQAGTSPPPSSILLLLY